MRFRQGRRRSPVGANKSKDRPRTVFQLMAALLSAEARSADAGVIGVRPDRIPFSGRSGIGGGHAHLGPCRLIGLPEAVGADGPYVRLCCLGRLRSYKAWDQ